MKKLLLAACVASLSGTALAGTPVSITSSDNTVTAPVDSVGLHVVISGGGTGGAAQKVQGADAANAATVGNPVLVGATDGTNTQSLTTVKGAIAAAGAGTGTLAIEEGGALFSHISTNATTTVKSGGTILHSICINTKGASANVATVYNNTAGSAPIFAVIDTTAGVNCLKYEAYLGTGLTIVTATGTAADITVSYR